MEILGLTFLGTSTPRRAEMAAFLRERSTIELDPRQLEPSAVAGLEEFSHIEVVFQFHRVAAGGVEGGARHPRGREDLPGVGILAQRAKRRPNRLGLSSCRLLGVRGLALDVKPYFHGFEPRGETREPAWTADVMAEYLAERDES